MNDPTMEHFKSVDRHSDRRLGAIAVLLTDGTFGNEGHKLLGGTAHSRRPNIAIRADGSATS